MSDPTAPEIPEARRALKRRLKRAIRWIVTIAVVGIVGYFFVRALCSNWDEVVQRGLAFHWGWVLATAFLVVAVPVTGLCWRRIILVLDRSAVVGKLESISVQCLSWVLKYIPGQVGSVTNKVLWAKGRGISRTLVVISFIYENVFLQLASLVPASVILLLSLGPELFGENATLLLLPLLAIVPLVLVVWKPAFHKILNVPARRVLKQDIPELYFLGSGETLRSIAEFTVPRVLNAIGFVILAATVVEVSPGMWLPLGAAYVFAAAIGILAVFVPSGLGVREAIIVLILSQYMATTDAIVISLLSRLLFTFGDLVIAGVYLATRRAIPKELRP